MPKMSLWPGFQPVLAGRAYTAGFMRLTYKGMGWEGSRGEGGDVKGGVGEKGRGAQEGERGREGKDHIGTFSHFKPWARVTG